MCLNEVYSLGKYMRRLTGMTGVFPRTLAQLY
jgi:hypothetical protein